MRRDLPKPMLKKRKAKVIRGPGESWFYVCRSGLEFYSSSDRGRAASNGARITVSQMEHALRIIQADKEGAK